MIINGMSKVISRDAVGLQKDDVLIVFGNDDVSLDLIMEVMLYFRVTLSLSV